MKDPKAAKSADGNEVSGQPVSSRTADLEDIDAGWDFGDEAADPAPTNEAADGTGDGDAGESDGDAGETGDAGESEADAGDSDGDAGDSDGDAGDSDGDAGDSDGDAGDSEADAGETGDGTAATAEITIDVFGLTDVGRVREHNEDNFLIADLTTEQRGEITDTESMAVGEGGILLAVCDGMGGAAAGEVASQMATDIIFERMRVSAGHRDHDRVALNIIRSLEDAGRLILGESNKNRACRGMGTTATVVALVDARLMIGQVGDSRAYILRGDRLVQVTRDQSLVNQLIEAGQLTEEEAENFEHSNIILQALGTAEVVQVDLTSVDLCAGDRLMMCSDGLSGMIRDLAIHTLMADVTEPGELANLLIQRANEAGGHDNVTVVVANFDGESLPQPSDSDVDELRYEKYALPAEIVNELGSSMDDRDTLDDSPYIEILGEFDVPDDVDWEEVLGIKRASRRPTADGPSSTSIVLILLALCLLVFFLTR